MILVENIHEELKPSMEWMKIFKNLLMIDREDQTKIAKAICPQENKNKTKNMQKVKKKKKEQEQVLVQEKWIIIKKDKWFKKEWVDSKVNQLHIIPSKYLNIEKQHMSLNNSRKLEKIIKIKMKKIIKNLKMNKNLEMTKKKEKIMMNCPKIRIKAWKKCLKDRWNIKIILEYKKSKPKSRIKNKKMMEDWPKINMPFILIVKMNLKLELKHKISNNIIIKKEKLFKNKPFQIKE